MSFTKFLKAVLLVGGGIAIGIGIMADQVLPMWYWVIMILVLGIGFLLEDKNGD
jgi:hypothetical protein